MTIENFLKLSRPRFWFYTLGPYIIGISAGNDFERLLRVEVLYGFFYFLIPANLFIYGVNDYFDRSLDLYNPKKHTQETYMNLQDRKLYVFLIVVAALLSLPLFFVNSMVTGALLTFIFFGFFYSSPPLRFKTKLFFDSLSNFFYIIPGIIGYILIINTLPRYTILLAASLWAIAMHLFSAIVDIESDTNSGIKTTATILGYKRSLVLTSLLWFTSVGLMFSYSPVLFVGINSFILLSGTTGT